MADSQADMIEGARSGNERAFRELHRHYWATMVRAAAQILPPDLAKDAVQDVMFLIWRNRSSWSVTAESLDAYMYRAARNRALEIARKEKLAATLSTSNSAEHSAAEHVTPVFVSDPQRQVMNNELAELMREAIDDLSPRSREAFLLSREREMSQSEIASTMGVSTETVKTQLKRATAALRRALRGYVNDS